MRGARHMMSAGHRSSPRKDARNGGITLAAGICCAAMLGRAIAKVGFIGIILHSGTFGCSGPRFTAGSGGSKNGLVMYRGDPSTNMDVATLPITGVPLDSFTYVAVTFDGAQVRMYRNGIESDSVPAAASIPNTDGPLVVGQGFAGALDELAIYEKALAADRISAHYRAGIAAR